MKKLLEAWLTNTLVNVLNKQAPCTTIETTRARMVQQGDEQGGQPDPSTPGITHNVTDSAGDGVLAAFLK